MLKNKKFIIFTIIFSIMTLLSITSGWCVDELVQHTPEVTQNPAFKSTLLKFIKVMAGVATSSVIIFIGLVFYNKILAKTSSSGENDDCNILATPKNIDSAVAFFIKRNKM